jgi:hypothetical protein
MSLLQQAIGKDHPFVKIAPITQCTSRKHLEEYYSQLRSQGGKGVILRKPKSLYLANNSLKVLKDDNSPKLTYAVVTNQNKCKLANGVEVSIQAPKDLQNNQVITIVYTKTDAYLNVLFSLITSQKWNAIRCYLFSSPLRSNVVPSSRKTLSIPNWNSQDRKNNLPWMWTQTLKRST